MSNTGQTFPGMGAPDVEPDIHERQFDFRTEEACNVDCQGCAARRLKADRDQEEALHV